MLKDHALRKSVPGSLGLALGAVSVAAAIAFTPISMSGDPLLESDTSISRSSFRTVERVAMRDHRWVVLAREFSPTESDWSLVLWLDTMQGASSPQPMEILVLDHQAATGSTVATVVVRDTSLVNQDTTNPFTGFSGAASLRGNLHFRSTYVCASDDRDLESLVSEFLVHRIQELEQPDLSLTAHHF